MINLKNIVRKNILKLLPYSSARDEFSGKEGIFLDANENPFGTLNRYPDPLQKVLKEKLVDLKNINAKNIFVGNGSDEVIDLAFRIFCTPGLDKVLTFTPTYGMYEVLAGINDIAVNKIPLNKNFQIDLDKLKPYLKDPNTKIIFICSPNNPSGNLMDRSDVEFILNNFKGIVFIDEAYIDFANEESAIGWLNRYNNLIVSQTFSKAWGLAAARIGVAYANEEVISIFNKVKPPYNISELNQKVAINSLSNHESFQKNLKTIQREKRRLKDGLQKLELVKKIYPSDSNFFLVEVDNADEVYAALVKQQIIIRNRNIQVRNCLRISVGSLDENQKLLTALKNCNEKGIVYR